MTALLTTAEVAERLAVHKRTVERMCANGVIYAVKVGAHPRRWRIPAEAFASYMRQREAEQCPDTCTTQ